VPVITLEFVGPQDLSAIGEGLVEYRTVDSLFSTVVPSPPK
jgi:hypothetical protein